MVQPTVLDDVESNMSKSVSITKSEENNLEFNPEASKDGKVIKKNLSLNLSLKEQILSMSQGRMMVTVIAMKTKPWQQFRLPRAMSLQVQR